jgi:hypothetical protein
MLWTSSLLERRRRVKDVTAEDLRRVATLAGYAWTAEELERLRPLVVQSLAMLERLDGLPLGDVEPAVVYGLQEERP